jgi:divinyl chlorophyllide a 8-vinyl-reductase
MNVTICTVTVACRLTLSPNLATRPEKSLLSMTDSSAQSNLRRQRVLVLGATGTIGRATVLALSKRGHAVVCLVRPKAGAITSRAEEFSEQVGAGAIVRIGQVTDASSIAKDGFQGESFDAVVSCLASRSGAPDDAWAIDYAAHCSALEAAQNAGISHFVLLSAICVQKPMLAFQHAKLAFEKKLIESGVPYSIVRPTAFFKSLSGQLDRLKRGKPFLVFGHGELTACKPISDRDLAEFLADCLHDPSLQNRVLPIGGPGDAITPLQQGQQLFSLLGLPPRFRRVPIALLDGVIALLTLAGRAAPRFARYAELARIGRYYATESMLVLNLETGRYDASNTPSTGNDTLFDHYRELVSGRALAERGDFAVF